jgi:prepilin-type N-terminal cleavage/methylation domain-containing protein
VIPSRHQRLATHRPAFSLLELVVVIAITSVLLVAGINIIGSTGPQSRRAATDTLSGLVEQARTLAITSRSTVVLAIAEPGDLPDPDRQCRIGLFKALDWPANSTALEAEMVRRWDVLPTGVVLAGGEAEGLRNPLDLEPLTIRFGSGDQPQSGTFRAIAFNARGGLLWPEGSDPVILRVAEGTYRDGRAAPNVRDGGVISENRLKIGRVVARPYRSN